MNWQEARTLLKELGLTQVQLASEMRALTGRKYTQQMVCNWFSKKGRGPSDTCIVYLKMKKYNVDLH